MRLLSETDERWTSLTISHDERIMTAIARNKARARCNAMANATRNFCELAGTGDNFQSPRVRDDDRESRRFQDQGCVGTLNCLIFFCGSFRDLAHESCIKGANHVRGEVLKFTLVVDNDSVHTQHAFSPMVMNICSHSSQMRTLRNGSRKRSTAHCDTQS